MLRFLCNFQEHWTVTDRQNKKNWTPIDSYHGIQPYILTELHLNFILDEGWYPRLAVLPFAWKCTPYSTNFFTFTFTGEQSRMRCMHCHGKVYLSNCSWFSCSFCFIFPNSILQSKHEDTRINLQIQFPYTYLPRLDTFNAYTTEYPYQPRIKVVHLGKCPMSSMINYPKIRQKVQRTRADIGRAYKGPLACEK